MKFLMLSEASLREIGASLDREEEQQRVQAAQVRAWGEDIVRRKQLYQTMLAGAGEVSFPGALPTPAESPAQDHATVEADREREPSPQPAAAAEESRVSEPTEVRRPRYTIKRGGHPTYADVIWREVPLDEFSVEQAWEIISPLISARPEDWRRSLRRSLSREGETRFEPVEGMNDWFRRVKPRTALTELMESTSEVVEDGEDEVQKGETAEGVAAPTAVSDDRFGVDRHGNDKPRLELTQREG